MSPTVKCIIGFFLLLCFVQYIEMAVIPHDDNAAQQPTSELAINLRDMLDGITDLLTTVVDGDTIKKVVQDFTKTIEATEKADR